METIIYDVVLGLACAIVFILYNYYFLVVKAKKESHYSAHGSYVQHRKNWITCMLLFFNFLLSLIK